MSANDLRAILDRIAPRLSSKTVDELELIAVELDGFEKLSKRKKWVVFTAGADEFHTIGDANGQPFDNANDAIETSRKYEDDEVYAYAVTIEEDKR